MVLFPGLAADKTAMRPLHNLCEQLGYTAHDWGRGINTGPVGDVDAWIGELGSHVQHVAHTHDSRVSLIGWSLGGIYAREIARLVPGAVRQVITLGTPFAGDADATHAGWLFRMLSGRAAVIDDALLLRLRCTPPVPTTSIYSRSDGIVAWQACLEACHHERAESVEVAASHIGLVWHPAVWAVIADRLAQPEGLWRSYPRRVPAANDARALLSS